MATFQTDIYYSYALEDNQVNESAIGWVDSFRKFLELLLNQILGYSPKILNYKNQEKPKASYIETNAIFIAILSPNYVLNSSCLEELNEFCILAQKNNQLAINGQNRIFKVTKLPVETQQQPTKIANYISYDLFQTDQNSQTVSEVIDFLNQGTTGKRFWLKLVDLAFDISLLLKDIKQKENFGILVDNLEKKCVYLAETGSDLQLHRDNIKRELIRHGFQVLPHVVLPRNLVELEVFIKQDLARSVVSIHLIGDDYGHLLENSSKSVLDVQNKLAAEHATVQQLINENNPFHRLIWISPDAKLEDDKQKIFIDNLRRELEENAGSEIFHSPIEEFKSIVLGDLIESKKILGSRHKTVGNLKNQVVLYLIYDKMDAYDARKLAANLNNQDVKVLESRIEGSLYDMRETHLEYLMLCDFAIIFVGKANNLWVQMKYLDLLKAPGLGRNKKYLPKAIYLNKSADDRASDFGKYDILISNSETDLEQLISEFRFEMKQ
jgi:hypothetical protein